MDDDDVERLHRRLAGYLHSRQSGPAHRSAGESVAGFEAEAILEALVALLSEKIAEPA